MKQISEHSKKWLFYLFYFILLENLTSQSVTYQDLHNNSTFEAKQINSSLPVGSIPGSSTVSQGVASYTIPIQIPAGTNNVVPSLSINYQSQGGDGLLGIGWTLTGLSVITRNIKSHYHDGYVGPATIDANDRFAIDGTRMIATNGTYGAANTSYAKEMEDFSQITSYGVSGTGPSYFKLETKEGVVFEYGNTADSKFMAKNNTDVLLWRLNRIIYKDGNYIDYIYETVSNETRIKEIKYTGNNTVSPVLLPYNSITFEYKSRDTNHKYKNTTYEADRAIALNSLMTKITIHADGQLFKSYSLNYANNGANVFLNEVIETGSDGTSSLNSTIFKYGDQPVEITRTSIGFSDIDGVDLIPGDFNGDGYTDLAKANRTVIDGKLFHTGFSLFTKVPSDAGGTFTFKYNKTFPFNGRISNNKSNFNFFSSDFNGDGRDDIAVPMTMFFSPLPPLHSYFVLLKIYIHNTGASSATELDIQLPSGAYNQVSLDKKYITYGDFNGDGIRDALVITKNSSDITKAYIWYGNSGATVFTELSITGVCNFSISNWETRNLNTLDFDGDGKDEIMITKGATSEIFSIDGSVAKSIKVSGFPTEWHLMYFGDFNGDRKTDILTRGSLNDNWVGWNVAYSTGKDWIEKPFTFYNVPPEVNEHYEGHNILVADFNGDGRSDIIHHFNFSGQPKIIRYYSLGNEFSFVPGSDAIQQSSINVIGDFNSDGKSDFLGRPSPTDNAYIYFMNKTGQELLLQRIKNGEDHITQFSYTRMSEPGAHYSKGTGVHPFQSATLPMYLVTRLDKDGLAETTYSYHDGIIHRMGKGFLGFRVITESGPSSASLREGSVNRSYSGPKRFDFHQKNYSSLSTDHAMLVLDTVVLLKGIQRINKRRIVNQLIQQNTGTLQKILWHKIPDVVDDNLMENTRTAASNLSYDTDGNVTESNIIYYAKTGGVLTEVERTVTVSEYGMYGSFRKNVPTSITNTTTRAGESAYSNTVKYTYNTLGQTLTRVDFWGLPKALAHTYTYNGLGNITGVALSSAGLTSRSSANVYDAKGRYIVSSTNAAGQVSTTTYDQKWAKPLVTTGVDGIKTKYDYDVFGRLIKTYYRKDLADEYNFVNTYSWVGTGYAGLSYIHTTHPGKPDVKTYFDNLGRKIAEETEGFQGYWIKNDYIYDGVGNLIFHKGPYRPALSEPALETTTVYDEYGRLKTITNALRTIEYSYDYMDGKKKVTQILDLPPGQTDQVSSQTTDVTGKVISATDDEGTLDFTYYSHGNLRHVKKGTVTYSSMEYDLYARQTKLTDINSGVTTYEYNAYGELYKENQPSNNNHTFAYNTLGNITSRTGTEGTTSYLYYTTGVKINKLQKITSFKTGYETSFDYDNTYSKLTSSTEKINGTDFVTSFTYNKYDDLLTTTYPSGVVVTNEYDVNGFLSTVKNGSVTLFTNQGMTPYNNYSKYQYGNNLITDITYFHTFPTRFYSRNSTETTKRQDLNLAWNYGTGNLTSRYDALVSKTETFQYDIMNRLTSAQVGSNPALTMAYSSNGNMTVKSDAAGTGGMEYLLPKINAVSKIQNPVAVPYDTQIITYAPYQRPVTITEKMKSLTLHYASDYERRMAVFKTGSVTDETRWYVGNYEKQVAGSTTREIHYVSNGERPIAIIVKEGSTVSNYYVHTDHLGSILAVTNSSMGYEAQQNYDPWGRKRNVTDWGYTGVSAVPAWLYRGFTGHEEYPQFNLINMNARLYDPHTGRMLSPDIAVSLPYSTQGYNRYSYAKNNPLKYTDPDGNEPISAIIIGAVISVALNGISNIMQDRPFFTGWLKAAVIGAVSGGVSDGIGWVANNIVGATKLEIAISQGLMHGWSGSMVAMLQWSNPGTGYVSGFFSSITSSAVQNLGSGKVATVIGGGLTGGVGAIVSGGNFFQGATYGLIASSLNHIAHVIVASSSAGHGDPPTKEQLKIRMYEEYASGRKSQIEYILALDIIDKNPLGMLHTLWEFYKVEMVSTVAGMGLVKFFGLAAKGVLKPLGLGSTGRTAAANLTEQLAMKEIMSNPTLGKTVMTGMKDSRWLGWNKMQYTHTALDGTKTTIHYVGQFKNGVLKAVDDFKFVSP